MYTIRINHCLVGTHHRLRMVPRLKPASYSFNLSQSISLSSTAWSQLGQQLVTQQQRTGGLTSLPGLFRMLLSTSALAHHGVFSQCHSKHYNRHSSDDRSTTFLKYLVQISVALGLSCFAYKSLFNQEICLFQKAFCLTTAAEQSISSQPRTFKLSAVEITDQMKIGTDKNENGKILLTKAIEKTRELCTRRKEEVSSPGIVVCVSVDGQQVYAEGIGYADLENRVPIKPNSVLRIASISKAFTATIVAKMWERGQIDLEKPVQHYFPSFPHKTFMGKQVTLTLRQLLNHTSGLRHYKSKDDPVAAMDQTVAELVGTFNHVLSQPFYTLVPNRRGKAKEEDKVFASQQTARKKELSEFDKEEYYLTRTFPTTQDSLSLFAHDPLVAKPGTKFVYSTFGYTLLAAIVESVLKKPFPEIVRRTLRHMGLKDTYLDQNDPIIYNRARYYVKDQNGCIVNAPYVDLSYKWAGGGLLSTAENVVQFGNILLYSAQHQENDPGPPGFLKASTMWTFWAPQNKKDSIHSYGLGFELTSAKELCGMCEQHSFGVGHTGGAVGVSSALFILPGQARSLQEQLPDKASDCNSRRETTADLSKQYRPLLSLLDAEGNCLSQEKTTVNSALPQGVVVAVFVNMIGVSVRDTAEQIARLFQDVDLSL